MHGIVITGNMHGSLRYFALFERTERDTYRGINEKIGDVCLFIGERA